jgi:hypothetical protein
LPRWDFLFDDDEDDDNDDEDEDEDGDEDVLYRPYLMGAEDSSDEEEEFSGWE